MSPPSQIAIATSSLNRLVKEEASYHKELQQQQASIAKLEQGSDEENAEYMLRQEVGSIHVAASIYSSFYSICASLCLFFVLID